MKSCFYACRNHKDMALSSLSPPSDEDEAKTGKLDMNKCEKILGCVLAPST